MKSVDHKIQSVRKEFQWKAKSGFSEMYAVIPTIHILLAGTDQLNIIIQQMNVEITVINRYIHEFYKMKLK